MAPTMMVVVWVQGVWVVLVRVREGSTEAAMRMRVRQAAEERE